MASKKSKIDFRVPASGDFSLESVRPDSTGSFPTKEDAKERLAADIEELSKMQAVLYAQDTYSLLLIFQGMDTSGKDGVIKHVLTGVNPQGVDVHSFKAPSDDELDHVYLWRCAKVLPERGRIGIFNRSYYEEVLTVKVHPELLKREKLPKKNVTKDIWTERYTDLNNFERYLTRNGVVVLKFFLHISKEEQRKRLEERIDSRDKNYKITPADIHERTFWKEYMKSYEEMLRHTSTEYAPWFVVPSDHKWYTRAVVASTIVETLKSLDLEYPELTAQTEKLLVEAKKALDSEK